MITPTQKVRLALLAAKRHGLHVRLDARGRLLVQPQAAMLRLPGVAAVLVKYKDAMRAVLKETSSHE